MPVERASRVEQAIEREVNALNSSLAAFFEEPGEKNWRAIQAAYRRLFMISASLGAEVGYRKPRVRVKAISRQHISA